MQPRVCTSRHASPTSRATERRAPSSGAGLPSPEAFGRRATGALVGCALGVCLAACAARTLPEATLRYRHARDRHQSEHRVELWLTHTPAPPAPGPPLELAPFLAGLDPCPGAPHCDQRALWIEEAERRHLFRDPLLEDPAIELRFDDVMPPAELGDLP